MYKFSNPMIFLSTVVLIMSTLMALMSTSWIFMWAGMEINMLAFIPLMLHSNNNQETEAVIKYFMVQAFGSSLLLMSTMSLWFIPAIPINLSTYVLMLALLVKIGVAPCHMWYPSIMTSINWVSSLILSTWQKLAPLAVINFILPHSATMTLLFLGALNAIIGGLVGMNQAHLRTMMAYSSITHMGWMLALAAMNKAVPTALYFMIYAMLIAPIFLVFSKFLSNTSSSLNKLITKYPIAHYIIPLSLLSLGGLPPLTGFLPKWMTIELLSSSNPYILGMLIGGAMMNLYFYLNISFSMTVTPMLSSSMPEYKPDSKVPFNPLIVTSLTMLFFMPVIWFIYAMTMFYQS